MFAGCPYCERVQDVAEELGLQIPHYDISEDHQSRKALLQARGRTTVPVLRIKYSDGTMKWLPESEDIIRYLASRTGKTVTKSNQYRTFPFANWLVPLLWMVSVVWLLTNDLPEKGDHTMVALVTILAGCCWLAFRYYFKIEGCIAHRIS
jgi:glutaredoxin